MTLLFFSVLLAAGVTFWVIHPILARQAATLRDVAPGGLLDAEARKRVALSALSELEYDYLGGKLDEPDYKELRDRLSLEALQAIRAAERVAVPAVRIQRLAGPVHECGFTNPPGSRFCGGCGTQLA